MIDETKSDLLPGSGVDTDKFSPVKNSKNTKFIFLFIARLIKDKGICELIEAVQILSKNRDDFSLYLLGETGVKNKTAISKDELEIWLKNDFINYLGKSDDVRDTICGSDCVVLPSYREGTPRSLLEAASMAKPIVTTNVTGCKEVVDDGINGLLCEVKNAKDLAQKMEKMLNLSDEERRRMGTSGREKMIKRFDEKIVISKYLEIIL
ncbi:glycosyltransferase [Campylobacter curvus]|uniref:glycosyltransferase n=1 Tax=Campylobacter curvus TaxID=200 RepID=UPI0020168064|nr:glycosyltransferase [Campylobacter curvus]